MLGKKLLRGLCVLLFYLNGSITYAQKPSVGDVNLYPSTYTVDAVLDAAGYSEI